jgi:hypothetical protein
MFDELLSAITATPVGIFMSQNEIAFPVAESIHVIGVALVFGTISIVDLRLLGVFRGGSSAKEITRDLLPWTWVGFALAVITGLLMFSSNAPSYWANTPFKLKMVALALAGINMLIFELITARSMERWDHDGTTRPSSVRAAGLLSLTFWIGVVVLGRWIGFTISPVGLPVLSF